MSIKPLHERVTITFSEHISKLEAEEISNYSISNTTIIESIYLDSIDSSKVHVRISELENGQSYVLTVNNIKDLNGNIIVDSVSSFDYYNFSEPSYRDIVINEFIVDPDSQTNIPIKEFVELYNPTQNFYQLGNWKIGDKTSLTSGIDPYILRPNSYLIICAVENTILFETYGETIGVAGFPNFNSASYDEVILLDNNGDEIDRINYTNPPQNGVTYEQINSLTICNGEFNFYSSSNADGGTPGYKNSVFDTISNLTGPKISEFRIIGHDEISILYNEPLDTNKLFLSSFNLENNSISRFTLENNLLSLFLVDSIKSEKTS